MKWATHVFQRVAAGSEPVRAPKASKNENSRQGAIELSGAAARAEMAVWDDQVRKGSLRVTGKMTKFPAKCSNSGAKVVRVSGRVT